VLKRASVGVCVATISVLSFGGMAGASAKSQAIEWAKQNKSVATRIRHDLQSFTTAGDTGNLKQLETACNQLASDVSSAQKRPPIPVRSLENLWSRALSDFATGANSCRTAFIERDEKESSKASASGNRASAELNSGVNLYNALSESVK
jgi:replication fork clamp-binding protein CrfC